MKKLYRKGTVHPSPPIISDQLSFLPATILTLTAALSPEDREVLAYLISCSSNNNFSGNPRRRANKNNISAAASVDGGDHAPLFHCSCFRCYMSYWVRWDSSPNRQLIHEIIDAFEDWLAQQTHKGGKNSNGGRKEKKNKRGNNKQPSELNRSELMSSVSNESGESESVGESSNSGDGEGGDGVGDIEEKGSVRRFVSFIGERIWGAWGQ